MGFKEPGLSVCFYDPHYDILKKCAVVNMYSECEVFTPTFKDQLIAIQACCTQIGGTLLVCAWGFYSAKNVIFKALP